MDKMERNAIRVDIMQAMDSEDCVFEYFEAMLSRWTPQQILKVSAEDLDEETTEFCNEFLLTIQVELLNEAINYVKKSHLYCNDEAMKMLERWVVSEKVDIGFVRSYNDYGAATGMDILVDCGVCRYITNEDEERVARLNFRPPCRNNDDEKPHWGNLLE